MLHHIPSVNAPFMTWAAVLGVLAVVIGAAFLGGLVRRHLARLTACLAIGAATGFGVTAWADGQRRAALTAAAHAGGHAPGVTFTLWAAFTVVTIVTAAAALAISAAAGAVARRRARRPYRGQFAPARRG
jgi:hypothetical protein